MIPFPIAIMAGRGGPPGEARPTEPVPYPLLIHDSYAGTAGATVDIDLLANDSAMDGTSLTLTSVTVSAGSASILNNKARVTWPGTAQTVQGSYRARNGSGLESIGTFTATVQAAAVPLDMRFGPPHKPASEAEVTVWSCPAAGGNPPQGDWTKYLLIAMPTVPVTGPIGDGIALRYKGVLLRGGVMRPVGTIAKTISIPTDGGGGGGTPMTPTVLSRDEVGVDAPFAANKFSLPTATRTVNVASGNATALSSALSNAQPGDHIVLAGGSFSGTFTLSANGTSSAPIVIRPASVGGATLTGKLVLQGQYTWAYGLRIDSAGGGEVDGPVQMRGSRQTVARCTFVGRGKRGIYVPIGARYWNIGYCDFTSGPPANATAQQPRYDQIMVNDSGSEVPYYGHIFCCYFYFQYADNTSESHHVYVGNGFSPENAYFEPDQLIFERCLVGTPSTRSQMRRHIYTKRGGWFKECTFYIGRGEVGFRNGRSGRMWACYFDSNGVNVQVDGPYHDLRYNRIVGTGCELHCTRTTGANGGGNNERAADDAFLLGNNIPTTYVGWRESGDTLIKNVTGVRVYNHTGTVTLQSQSGTVQNNNYTGPETGSGGTGSGGTTGSTLNGIEAAIDLRFDGNDAGYPSNLPRPYFWIDGLDYDAAGSGGSAGATQACWWGHLFRLSTNDATNAAHDRWCDIVLQRIKVGVGHYWLDIAGDTEPQSEYLRPATGFRRILMWRNDVAWFGGGVRAHVAAGWAPHPEGYVEIADTAFRSMPQSTAVKAAWSQESIPFLDADATEINPQAGAYYGLHLKNFWIKPEDWADASTFVQVKSPATRTVGAASIALSSYKGAATGNPYNYTGATFGGPFARPSGSFEAFVSLGTPGQAMVSTAEVGAGVRVTTAAGLLGYLGTTGGGTQPLPDTTQVYADDVYAYDVYAGNSDPGSGGGTEPPPPSTTFKSGLTWRSGIRDGTTTDSVLDAVETWRGRPLDMTMTYVDKSAFDVSWTACINHGALSPTGVTANMLASGRDVAVCIPLLIQSEAQNFAAGAAGQFDTYHQQMANKLAAIFGSRMFWCRLGWEANRGFWWSWEEAGSGSAANYRTFWRRIANIYKTTCPGVRMEWCLLKRMAIPAEPFYPGNDRVDVIAIDFYDNGSGGYMNNSAGWSSNYGSYNPSTGDIQGLGGMLAFAKAKGKKLAVPEWGPTNAAGTSSDPTNTAYYVTQMFNFFKNNAADLEYECYSNYGDHRLYERQSMLGIVSDTYRDLWRP